MNRVEATVKLRDRSSPAKIGDGTVGGVLVVDDSPAIRELLPLELGPLNVDVTTAANGAETIRLCQAGLRPAVAIFDYHLPDMTGLELCQHLRARASLSSTYVILLTSDEALGRVASLHDGADDYLSKPYETRSLHAAVRTGLRAQAFQRAAVRRARRDAIMWLAMVAAHEINNPLAAALSNMESLIPRLEGPAAATERDCVRDSLEALQRIRAATARMQINGAVVPPHPVRCSVGDIERGLCDSLGSAGIAVRVDDATVPNRVVGVDAALVILAVESIVAAGTPHCTGTTDVSIRLDGSRLTIVVEMAGGSALSPDTILEPALVDDGATTPRFEPRLAWLEERFVAQDGQILTSRVDDKWRFGLSLPVEPLAA